MKTSSDVPESYRRSLAGIDYTSPVCKINVALDRIPNFLADPNSSSDGVMPHHQATIHLNCEDSEMIEWAYSDAKSGIYSRNPLIEMHSWSSTALRGESDMRGRVGHQEESWSFTICG